ncbi:hypothetical protein Agabi119p4_10929 [Agaricus bisporus var. burnettii]|uniref:F-box domain-containing protein n=1 Tax=Agaricus bisporus var. burnettii TaxID=192524 RepID=A0A8H7EVJ9_AGABI|nr:hypothetical protein Agabi119p4_10929 [Agaricus bisporus var. burnettii]
MDSFFSDKLNSNYVPSDDEIVAIKELLVEPHQRLKDISGEIGDIESQLERLLKEKGDLDDQLKAHKALLSPARRLSPNVIQKIFLYCLPSEHNPVMSSREAPLLLGRICSQWRDIALATPQLWSAIHIAIPADPPVAMPIGTGPPAPPPQTDHTSRIQAIVSWLTRADPFPLFISLYTSRFDSVVGNSIQLYLDAIVQFASRWKQLHMSVPHQVWNNFLPRIRANDVPILEKVYLDSAMGYHGVPGSPGTGARRDSGLLKAPNLTSLSLVQFEIHVLHLPLRWSKLKELNLSGSIPTWQPVEGFSITESLSVLSLCPNLEYFSVQLSLAGFVPLSNGDYGLPKITLNKLDGLAVTETCNVDSTPFFAHITAPALRRLKFRRTAPNTYMNAHDPSSTNSLRSIYLALAMFIHRVTNTIEELELDALYMSDEDVMKCLSLLPGLKKLSIWGYGPGAPPTPYATPTVSPWENTIFALNDKTLKRFVPGQSAEEDEKSPVAPPPGPFEDMPLLSTASPSPQSLRSPSLPSLPSSRSSSPDLVPPPVILAGSVTNIDGETQVLEGNTPNAGGSSITEVDLPAAFLPSLLPLPGDKGKSRATDSNMESEALIGFDALPDVLCPLLEDFQCSGAFFSDKTMLSFLRSRSCLASSTSTAQTLLPSSSSGPSSTAFPKPSPQPDTHYPLTHLRHCRISFSVGREETTDIKLQLDEIRREAAMNLDVHYPPAPASVYYKRYSPYDGLPSVPVLGAQPNAHVGGGTSTISSNGGLGSGEPVFLYSAAFH